MALLGGVVALVAAAAPGTAGAAGPHAKGAADKPFDARTRARLELALRRTWATTWAPGVTVGVWVRGRGWTSAEEG